MSLEISPAAMPLDVAEHMHPTGLRLQFSSEPHWRLRVPGEGREAALLTQTESAAVAVACTRAQFCEYTAQCQSAQRLCSANFVPVSSAIYNVFVVCNNPADGHAACSERVLSFRPARPALSRCQACSAEPGCSEVVRAAFHADGQRRWQVRGCSIQAVWLGNIVLT
jgi:hypothetical protein